MTSKRAQATSKLRGYRKEILKFVKAEFGVEPDRWQTKALTNFANGDHKIFRMSLQACAGPGKSAVLAWCGWWFLCTQGEKGSHPKGAAISVTWDNLKDNLWSEMSKWQQVSPLCTNLFTWTQSRIFAKQHPETWFLSARSFSKTANAEEQGRTLSGVHSKYVLFLIDESGDIPTTVLKATEQALSTSDKVMGRVLQAGNPTSVDGMLYAAQSSLAERWHVIKITGDPDDPDRSPRIDAEWAAEQIETYGRDDPWVMSYILGQFPKTGINSLLSVEEVEKAMSRHYRPEEYEWSQKRLGVDVARFGYDSTVIFPRQGLRAFNYVEMRKARTQDIAARVMNAKNKWGSEVECVDGTGGYGAGVIDNMLQSGANPYEVHFSEKAIDPRYFNKRAEMWFEMANWIKRGGAVPKSPGLQKELLAPTYSFKKGKFCLEEKEQIKKRLGFSPDKADALALTFAVSDMPAKDSPQAILGKPKYSADYDPLA